MKTELTQQLIRTYPNLFRDLTTIQCGDGWYNLIDIVCRLIQGYANRNVVDISAQPIFAQIKEKFGVLSIYYQDTTHEYIFGITDFAEHLSGQVCEVTGEPGTLHRLRSGTIKTLSRGVAEPMLATPVVPYHVIGDVLATPIDDNTV